VLVSTYDVPQVGEYGVRSAVSPASSTPSRRPYPPARPSIAHKQPKVLAWLARHPRFVFHFTPTSCSWLNAVETFFTTLTERRVKRSVFRSVVELQAAINRYLDEANHDPKPFLWTAQPDKIIAAVKCSRQALDSIH